MPDCIQTGSKTEAIVEGFFFTIYTYFFWKFREPFINIVDSMYETIRLLEDMVFFFNKTVFVVKGFPHFYI